MGQNENGLKQSPFSEAACPTPGETSGDQGIGGGLDLGAGPNGLTSVPWSNHGTPVPAGGVESGPFGNPSRYSTVDGSTHKDANLAGEITMPPLRTVDKR